jgi:hypothetical protein
MTEHCRRRVSVPAGLIIDASDPYESLPSLLRFTASADFLALGRPLVVLAHLALDCGDRFQFLRRVLPSAFDSCAFI